MDNPPPVPPKEMSVSRSKRKRTDNDDADDNLVHELRDGFTYTDDVQHTPKRSKSHMHQDTSESEAPSTSRYNGLRRKKGVNNLSNVNLRQEAELQRGSTPPPLPGRESKFQEGSLKDKPSEKPPSAFTRFIRTDSGNIQKVDRLMEDYHGDTDPVSTPAALNYNISTMDQDVNRINRSAREDDIENRPKGFFSWGDSFKINFRPVTIWKRVWNETKEELTRKNMEELQRKKREEISGKMKEEENRKAQQKVEAEARYAQMKASGQFAYTPVGNYRSQASASGYNNTFSMPSEQTQVDHTRNPSQGSHLTLPQTDYGSRTSSEFPQSYASSSRTLKNRLSTTFRKPSMFNLKSAFSNDLKRVKSEYNMAANQHSHDSSVFLPAAKDSTDQQSSPEEGTDFPPLKPTVSKPDLRKQHKLSKRVSDLEGKLQSARRELDEALVQASPMPKLGSRFERFTPTPGSTVKRPKVQPRGFRPGGLPSLPSERLLFANKTKRGQQASDWDVQMRDAERGAEGTEPVLTENMIATFTEHMPMDPSELMSEFEDDEETLRGRSRASRPVNQYPVRASSLFFGLPTSNNNDTTNTTTNLNNYNNDVVSDLPGTQTSELTPFTSDAAVPSTLPNNTSDKNDNSAMDPNFTPSTTTGRTDTIIEPAAAAEATAPTPTPAATASGLDAKLRALDAQVKSVAKAKKPAKGRKRKSGDEGEELFKPAWEGESEGSEDEGGKPRRKKGRKSAGAGGSKVKGKGDEECKGYGEGVNSAGVVKNGRSKKGATPAIRGSGSSESLKSGSGYGSARASFSDSVAEVGDDVRNIGRATTTSASASTFVPHDEREYQREHEYEHDEEIENPPIHFQTSHDNDNDNDNDNDAFDPATGAGAGAGADLTIVAEEPEPEGEGEMETEIQDAQAEQAGGKGGKVVSEKNAKEVKAKEEFEWPEDVF